MKDLKDILNNVTIPSHINKLKFDIGLSYNAPVSRKMLEQDANLFIYGVEPNIESINSVNEYVSEYLNSNRMCILPFALDNVEEPTEREFFNTSNDPGCSSLHKPVVNNITVGSVNTVTTYPLFTLFENINWTRFNYIEWVKIDAQGSDLDILKSAKNYLHDRVVYVTAEPGGHQYENCENCTANNINEYMLSQNFLPVYDRVSDPTFINKKFMHLRDQIFLHLNEDAWQTDMHKGRYL